MKQAPKKSSSEKENSKVTDKKLLKTNKIREDKNNSIRKDRGNKKEYPYEQVHDKQFDNQPEFIDRDSNSKDKS